MRATICRLFSRQSQSDEQQQRVILQLPSFSLMSDEQQQRLMRCQLPRSERYADHEFPPIPVPASRLQQAQTPQYLRYGDVPPVPGSAYGQRSAIPGWQFHPSTVPNAVGHPLLWRQSGLPQSQQLSEQFTEQRVEAEATAADATTTATSTVKRPELNVDNVSASKRRKRDAAATGKARKSYNFSEEETRALLEIWANEETYSQIRRSGIKKPIWERISSEMKKSGYNRTGDQYRQKLKDLEKKYKSIKEKMNGTGEENDTASFPYFEIMDSVMGTNPSVTPVCMIDSGNSGSPVDLLNSPTPSPSDTSSHLESTVVDASLSSATTETTRKRTDRHQKNKKQHDEDRAMAGMEERMAGMEQRFVSLIERQLKREEELMKERMEAENQRAVREQNFFLEALRVLKEQ